MIKLSQQRIIDVLNSHKNSALSCAVINANINCIKCLLANGADVTIGDGRYIAMESDESTIGQVIWQLSVISSDIFDLLIDADVYQNIDHFSINPSYFLSDWYTGNVNFTKKLIVIGAPLNVIASNSLYMWALVAREGNMELLKCMFNRGFDKDSKDQNGLSVLWYAVDSGNVEAVWYLLSLEVVIPTYKPDLRETKCEHCKETILIIDDDSIDDNQNSCMRTIRKNNVKIVKLLEEHGSQSCKSFAALRCAMRYRNEDVVSYLLNTFTYRLNFEKSDRVFTLLIQPFLCA